MRVFFYVHSNKIPKYPIVLNVLLHSVFEICAASTNLFDKGNSRYLLGEHTNIAFRLRMLAKFGKLITLSRGKRKQILDVPFLVDHPTFTRDF